MVFDRHAKNGMPTKTPMLKTWKTACPLTQAHLFNISSKSLQNQYRPKACHD